MDRKKMNIHLIEKGKKKVWHSKQFSPMFNELIFESQIG
jgi:hypothetical protein